MKEFNLPLKNKNIVITRAKDQISDVKHIFQDKGAIVYELPALFIDFPDDLGPLDSALEEINNFHWIIFSSSNGVIFLERRLNENGSSLKELSKNIKIAVVGEKTSLALIALGVKPDFIPPNFIADSLIENFPVSGYGLRILLPRVQTGGRNLIANQFRNAGARVDQVPVYDSKCPDSIPIETLEAIERRIIDSIIFSSGKTVHNSYFLLKKYFGNEWSSVLDKVKILSIGPQTSIVCKRIFGRVDKEADKFTFQGLLDAAIDCL